jgi:hypothetical protein
MLQVIAPDCMALGGNRGDGSPDERERKGQFPSTLPYYGGRAPRAATTMQQASLGARQGPVLARPLQQMTQHEVPAPTTILATVSQRPLHSPKRRSLGSSDSPDTTKHRKQVVGDPSLPVTMAAISLTPTRDELGSAGTEKHASLLSRTSREALPAVPAFARAVVRRPASQVSRNPRAAAHARARHRRLAELPALRYRALHAAGVAAHQTGPGGV